MKLLRETQVAELLGLRVKTIQRWRLENRGPEFRKLGGGSVRYELNTLEKWIQCQPAGGDSPDASQAS